MISPRSFLLGLALVCAWVPAAGAAAKKATLGVFLPTTLTDGQQRFAYAEALAAKLSAATGRATAAKSFARYEDFSKAVSEGLIDFAVVDSWAAVQLGKATPVALAPLSGETSQRWAIISTAKGSVKDLAGKRLAIVKGAGATDPKFVTNVVLAGDLDAKKHFKLTPVPNVESALKMLEAKGAEAALVPLAHVPEGVRVLFRSSKVPGAVLVGMRGDEDDLTQNLQKLEPVAPFGAFVAVQAKELEDFRRLLQSGPPRRQPVLVEAPTLRVETKALMEPSALQPVLPSFADALEVSAEQPDD
ncbi:phosphate/phosphite/phosphonate ABC transporter substrate-binding protein [Archangium violaceum]|uniref:PhnD/SsuA/transferrin family substrate-binding protein n=1 Tax=Archangium violaceum TaxID=83451 RepID=UPI002B290513|nr:phosphate/phosphite/phosphonate ABC transporter substrate-binding protein [Archangium violaceum]